VLIINVSLLEIYPGVGPTLFRVRCECELRSSDSVRTLAIGTSRVIELNLAARVTVDDNSPSKPVIINRIDFKKCLFVSVSSFLYCNYIFQSSMDFVCHD